MLALYIVLRIVCAARTRRSQSIGQLLRSSGALKNLLLREPRVSRMILALMWASKDIYVPVTKDRSGSGLLV